MKYLSLLIFSVPILLSGLVIWNYLNIVLSSPDDPMESLINASRNIGDLSVACSIYVVVLLVFSFLIKLLKVDRFKRLLNTVVGTAIVLAVVVVVQYSLPFFINVSADSTGSGEGPLLIYLSLALWNFSLVTFLIVFGMTLFKRG